MTAGSNPSYHLDDGIAIVTLDDGKANALDFDVIDTVHAHLDRAAGEARAIVLVGRPGKFCAGFNLAVMTESTDSMRRLVTAGAELLTRIYLYELPVVAACTGHALAAGALVLLASDVRIGASDVPAKIGLNEVAIGMPLPIFAVELARERLVSPLVFNQATLEARLFDADGAAEAGYLDRTVPADALVAEAVADARRLGEIRSGAYRETKRNARTPVAEHIKATLGADMANLTGPSPA